MTSADHPPTRTPPQNNGPDHNDKGMQRAIQNITITRDDNQPGDSKIALLFLDATWKYAQEMDKACTKHSVYPSQMVRVWLDPTTGWDTNLDDEAVEIIDVTHKKYEVV